MFKFVRDDASVGAGFRRIARDQIDQAIAELEGQHPGQGSIVHNVRRRCKKLRALLRLVRPAFPGYKRENAAIRDAAAGLASTRDAEALVETLNQLASEGDGSKTFAALAQDFSRDATGHQADARTPLDAFREDMNALRERAEGWALEVDGFEPLRLGLKRTYGATRQRMDVARRERDAVHLHEWRKGVKYCSYQFDLLRETAPDIWDTQKGLWTRLGEDLGAHHNLVLLGQRLRQKSGPPGADDELERILETIKDRRDALEVRALGLGRQLFAERPPAIARRFARYWTTWR